MGLGERPGAQLVVRQLMLLCMMLATKFLRDTPANNTAWVRASTMPGQPLASRLGQLNAAELNLLHVLQWRLHVHEHEFAAVDRALVATETREE